MESTPGVKLKRSPLGSISTQDVPLLFGKEYCSLLTVLMGFAATTVTSFGSYFTLYVPEIVAKDPAHAVPQVITWKAWPTEGVKPLALITTRWPPIVPVPVICNW